VVVDEAHERNINQDILLGLLRKILPLRPSLRVIICSATIDAQAFLDFFTGGNEPRLKGEIISVDGRTHEVEVMYLQKPAPNYVLAAVTTSIDIHESEGPGDVLVFLPQADDIEEAVRMCGEAGKGKKGGRGIRAMPLYAALPEAAIKEPFLPRIPNQRRVIFATSIAETR